MIKSQTIRTDEGEVLHDAAIGAVDARWLDADYWQALGAAVSESAGRGSIVYVETPVGAAVLRHYRRGGMVSRFNADRYLWTGADRSRAFVEFRLLATLHDAGLPVPAPIAARYQRDRWRYRADLLTARIVNAQTLADHLQTGLIDPELAAAIGETIARFHVLGVCHADLNAHNILTDAEGKVWLLDFDRGRLRQPAIGWQQTNLARLRRSLLKLGAQRYLDFDERFWHPLRAAYHAALGADR
ncbi:MAG: 3-deoxy-D-manno-octulosonic acid kinase [Dokdonella sp.]